MSTLEILFASLAAIIATLGIALPIWRTRHRYGLRWGDLESKSMMEIAEDIADDVTIQYKGRTIADMTKYQFILHNTGRTPLEKSDIVVPLNWKGPGAVLDASISVSDPPVDLSLKIKGDSVEFSWPLFNQGSMAVIEILCESGSPNLKGVLYGQIRDIPSIEEKKVSVADDNRISLWSRTGWFIRGMVLIFSIYWFAVAILALFVFVSRVAGGEVAPYVLTTTSVAIFFLITRIIFRFVRNPYTGLLKKAREQAMKIEKNT